jgi:hypothetical protein
MDDDKKRGLKVFLQYWVLFALLGAFNFYYYFKTGRPMFLVVAIICVVVFIGWVLFYLYYVRKGEPKSES